MSMYGYKQILTKKEKLFLTLQKKGELEIENQHFISYHRILFSNKKEQATDELYIMDESQKHSAR